MAADAASPGNRPAPSFARTEQQVDGRVETLQGRRLFGWAFDHSDRARKVPLNVYVDNKLIRKTVADRRRDDLAQAGIGDGAHGFEVELPRRLWDRPNLRLEICTPHPAHTLPWAAGTAELGSSLPPTAVFKPMRHDPPPEGLPEPRALVGRDGWLFLCDDANGSLDQLLGDLTLNEEDIEHYRLVLWRRHEALAALGIPYLFLVVPAKESIYAEMLPTGLPIGHGAKPLDQILEAVSGHPHPAPIDIRARLRARAASGDPLYYRQDAHWNYRGAWIAAQAIADHARAAGVALHPDYGRNLSWITTEFERGDIAEKEQVDWLDGRLLTRPAEEQVPSEPEQELRPDPWKLPQPTWPAVPDDLQISTTRPTVVLETVTEEPRPRAFVYCDSFTRWLRPYMLDMFSWSAHLWSSSIDIELIRRHRPDVVIQTMAERFLVHPPYQDRP